MKFVLPLLVIVLSGAFVSAEEATHTKEPITDIKKAVDDGKAVIVDVREEGEFDEAHVKGAIFLPLSAVNRLKNAPDNLPKDKVLYVHCAVGARALKAANIFKGFGLDARAMKQNVDDFEKGGFTKETLKK
jgi:phage shock protein E